MADKPLRLRVLEALSAAISEISILGGYTVDLEGAVFRGRDYFGEDDPIPMISILESPDEPAQDSAPRASAKNSGYWDLFIQGWAEDDKEHPTDTAHYLMADVKKRLGLESMSSRTHNCLGIENGKVDRLEFTPGVVRPPDAMSDKAYFWLRLRIYLVEDLTKPYD